MQLILLYFRVHWQTFTISLTHRALRREVLPRNAEFHVNGSSYVFETCAVVKADDTLWLGLNLELIRGFSQKMLLVKRDSEYGN